MLCLTKLNITFRLYNYSHLDCDGAGMFMGWRGMGHLSNFTDIWAGIVKHHILILQIEQSALLPFYYNIKTVNNEQ